MDQILKSVQRDQLYTVRQMRNVLVVFHSFLGSRLRRVGLGVVCACEMEAVCTKVYTAWKYVYSILF
jgi:hypothetical protein